MTNKNGVYTKWNRHTADKVVDQRDASILHLIADDKFPLIFKLLITERINYKSNYNSHPRAMLSATLFDICRNH